MPVSVLADQWAMQAKDFLSRVRTLQTTLFCRKGHLGCCQKKTVDVQRGASGQLHDASRKRHHLLDGLLFLLDLIVQLLSLRLPLLYLPLDMV